jgi:HK97 family phage prohead protease
MENTLNPKFAEFGDRLVKLHNGKHGLIGGMVVKITLPADAEGDCIDMRASDETLDRYDEVIKAAGWQLDNYLANPVVQNCHQYGDIIFTIGKALSTKVDGSALVQRWQFATDVNPMAKIAFGLYKGGYLNTSSVGFIPEEWTNGSKTGEPARTYTKQELLEVSAVGIPANPNALALAVKSGAIAGGDVKELATLLNKFCNQEEPMNDAGATVRGFHFAQLQLLAQVTAEAARHC